MTTHQISSQLPIASKVADILQSLDTHAQVVLKAETGAGKSTALPLALLSSGQFQGQIIMLEPRRLAAKSIASYLAKQLGEKVGQKVGYQIRGEQAKSQDTQLLIVTEGIMLAMLQSDPELTGVSLVIFDEFHERSLNADTSLAFCLESQAALREDLKLLIMSATLEKETFFADSSKSNQADFLEDGCFIECEGRTFPVAITYQSLKPNQELNNAVIATSLEMLRTQQGSLLVFLDGTRSIRYVERNLSQQLAQDLSLQNVDLYCLYGQMDLKAQQAAIAPTQANRRKIVLATNIAETSLTIDGISMVLDAGMEQSASFDLKTGITRLESKRISQASSVQRAGRAGRLQAGICVRLYSKEVFERQPLETQPEILRSDLTSLRLETLKWGARNVNELAWLNPPPAVAIHKADELLRSLGLLDQKGDLSAKMLRMGALSLDPRFLAMLIQTLELAQSANLPHLLDTSIALICLFEERRKALDLASDLALLQSGKHPNQRQLLQRSLSLSAQLSQIKELNPTYPALKLRNFKADFKHLERDYAGVLASFAYPDRIAYQAQMGQEASFLLANGHGAFLDPLSNLAKQHWIVVIDLLRHSGGQGRSQIFSALDLDFELLKDLSQTHELESQHWFQDSELIQWDQKRGQMMGWEVQAIGQICYAKQAFDKQKSLTSAQKTQGLINYLSRHGLAALNWNKGAQNLQQRVLCARLWLPEEEWPDMSEEALQAHLDAWLLPYLNGVHDLKALLKVNLEEALKAYLGWELMQLLDAELPTHWLLPTGRMQGIDYQFGQDPVLSVRMQEMFGQAKSPLIAKGRQAILVDLLSPAQRSLQRTKDLASFWQGSYQDVQKEMKGRYPKHIWPDDPANHQATRKTKRHFS